MFSFALRRLLVDAFGDAFDKWVSTKISAFSASSARSLALRSAWFYFDKVGESFVTRARVVGGGEERGAPVSGKRRCCAREFAADMAMQAFRSPAVAKGAVEAFCGAHRQGLEGLRDSLWGPVREESS